MVYCVVQIFSILTDFSVFILSIIMFLRMIVDLSLLPLYIK